VSGGGGAQSYQKEKLIEMRFPLGFNDKRIHATDEEKSCLIKIHFPAARNETLQHCTKH
jgi:hypothetical protein